MPWMYSVWFSWLSFLQIYQTWHPVKHSLTFLMILKQIEISKNKYLHSINPNKWVFLLNGIWLFYNCKRLCLKRFLFFRLYTVLYEFILMSLYIISRKEIINHKFDNKQYFRWTEVEFLKWFKDQLKICQ